MENGEIYFWDIVETAMELVSSDQLCFSIHFKPINYVQPNF